MDEPLDRVWRFTEWMSSYRKIEIRSGFTLMELVVVVAVISIIVLVAVSRTERVGAAAKRIAAESDLRVLRDAFLNAEDGYLRDMGAIPGFSAASMRVANLFTPSNLYVNVTRDGDLSRTPGVCLDDGWVPNRGCARSDVFVRWSAATGRGWRGPYVKGLVAVFPQADEVRFEGDASFGARGFFPELTRLSVPQDFLVGRKGCSIYGFPGEPTLLDPWGNPYVLQVPPPQAFRGVSTNLPEEVRFRYARLVSAGPDGRLDTPCFGANGTNWWATSWGERRRRLVRQAGLIDGDDRSARGDDLVLFLSRNDIDEGGEL